MSILLSIDPGLRACGCAVFNNGILLRAALVKNPEKKLRGPQAHVPMADAVLKWFLGTEYVLGPDELALEYPRVYPNHSNKRSEDPNDLIELAGIDGALAFCFDTKTRHYFPADWKGQTPANVCARQVLAALSFNEQHTIEDIVAFKKSLEARDALGKSVTHNAHNTLDAVGIGLHHSARF